MPLFADIEWATVATTAVSILTVVGGGFGWLVNAMLSHLKTQREEQRHHETGIMTRIEAVTGRFDATAREIQTEMRKESRETISTLLKIQSETVEAVADLSGRVGELGIALNELRTEVGRKADKHTGEGRL